MSPADRLRRLLPALLLGVALSAAAQSPPADTPSTPPYEPQIGQAGKDVIWVPSPDNVIERMLRMAQTTKQDYVIDLGSGDGKIAIAAARNFGARALGIEFNPDMVKLSRENARKAGVADKVEFVRGDFFKSDFGEATVLTMYLLPDLNLKLRPKILALRPGTRVVSHSFNMDEWEPDEMSTLEGKRAYFWVVPAKVSGVWTLELDGGVNGQLDLAIEQRFQKLSGYASLGRVHAGLRDGRLDGRRIRFAFVDAAGLGREFAGAVEQDAMQGTYRSDDGAAGHWRAVKR